MKDIDQNLLSMEKEKKENTNIIKQNITKEKEKIKKRTQHKILNYSGFLPLEWVLCI